MPIVMFLTTSDLVRPDQNSCLAPVDSPAVTKLGVSEKWKKSRTDLSEDYSHRRATTGSTLVAR
jgi:hypothetical protein